MCVFVPCIWQVFCDPYFVNDLKVFYEKSNYLKKWFTFYCSWCSVSIVGKSCGSYHSFNWKWWTKICGWRYFIVVPNYKWYHFIFIVVFIGCFSEFYSFIKCKIHLFFKLPLLVILFSEVPWYFNSNSSQVFGAFIWKSYSML